MNAGAKNLISHRLGIYVYLKCSFFSSEKLYSQLEQKETKTHIAFRTTAYIFSFTEQSSFVNMSIKYLPNEMKDTTIAIVWRGSSQMVHLK